MELIGKQIAIETILGQPPELHYPSWYAAQIEKLPPAPPEYLAEQAGILVTDTDTISRQAAIDALDTGLWGVEWDKALATAMLKDLPSAQPEIIRCKDCKWKNNHNCTRAVEVWIDDNKYCAWAERRTE